MFIIRKKFEFELAHQLHSAFSDCCKDCIHGHSYILEVFFASDSLDENSMVIDFGEVKSLIKNYVDTQYDHSLHMPKSFPDEYLEVLSKYNTKLKIVDYNPTAEEMAVRLYVAISKLIQPLISESQRKFFLWKVRIHETRTGYAEYSPIEVEDQPTD